MCDTMGFIKGGNAFFAKNSDRSPNEPQVVEFHPAKKCEESILKVTYIEIPQVKHTHAVLLSRPAWMWGAEIGVNDCGVCIGNEAVFTKGSYPPSGLTGMDLLRLALERGDSAKAALELIITQLEEHGQGGNCGFDKNFYYDNSFLIMDTSELYILETSAKDWVYKKVNVATISNRLSIGTDGTAYHAGTPYDFKKKHSDPVYSHFSGSKERQRQTASCLPGARDVLGLMSALRTHGEFAQNPLTCGNVRSTCMHAGGLIGDHTTQSMIVELGTTPIIWTTGCSTPCISVFKPYAFGNAPVGPVFKPEDTQSAQYWLKREEFHRSVIGKQLPFEYYMERDALEQSFIDRADGLSRLEMEQLSRTAHEEECAFYSKWGKRVFVSLQCSSRFLNYWKKKNSTLNK